MRHGVLALLLLVVTTLVSATVTRVLENAATSPLDVGASNETQVIECLTALSYQICDTDTSCRNRFYLDFFQSEPHRRSNFAYLLRVYLRLPVSGALPPVPDSVADLLVTPAWILMQLATLSPTDTDVGLPLLMETDAQFGTRCVEVTLLPGNNTSLWLNTTTQVAVLGRVWWLYVLRLADFCTENEIFDEELGCVCREGKVCDETDPGQYTFQIVAFIVFIVVAAGIYLWQMVTTGAQVRNISTEVATGTSASEALVRAVERAIVTLPATGRSSAASSAAAPRQPTAAASTAPVKRAVSIAPQTTAAPPALSPQPTSIREDLRAPLKPAIKPPPPPPSALQSDGTGSKFK